jgi:4-amino-4-deoxy-L-arabinose transferase-like glycosyltransferase
MNAMQPFSAKCTSRISRVVYLIAGAALAVHLYASGFYGYFTDELYYLACSRHLAWGYADQPPLIAILTAMTRVLLGTSLRALRILPTLAAAAEVIITGKITAELGGKRFAQGLAALGVLVAPGILSIDGFLSMNAFEPLIWMGCAWLVIRIVKTGNERLWIWAGVLAGIGLENKYSMLIFGAGLVVGLLLTPERRILASKWPWIGILIALAIFLPNLIWNVREHFPFLEIQENIRRSGRDVALGPIGFFGQEILDMQPLSAPVWMGGCGSFSRRKRANRFACSDGRGYSRHS